MEIEIREREGVTILDIKGHIAGSDPRMARLHQFVLEAVAEGKKNFLLTLAEVGFVDSTGVGEILKCLMSALEAGGRLKLVCRSFEKPRFLLPHSEKIVEIFEDEETDLKSFT